MKEVHEITDDIDGVTTAERSFDIVTTGDNVPVLHPTSDAINNNNDPHSTGTTGIQSQPVTSNVDDSADEITNNDKHQLTSNVEDDKGGDDDLEALNVVMKNTTSSQDVPVAETDASQPPLLDHGNTADTAVIDANSQLPQIHIDSNEYGIRNGSDDVGAAATTTTVASTVMFHMEKTNLEMMDHDNDDFGDFNDAVVPVGPTKDKSSMIVSQEETNDVTYDLDYFDSTLTTNMDQNCNNTNNKEEEEEVLEEEFGDFGTVPTAPVMVPSSKEEIPVHINHDLDDNFGNFQDVAAPTDEILLPTPSTDPNVTIYEARDNDHFGHFDSVPSSAHPTVITNNEDNDDDDFGDFDTAEATPVMATSTEPIPVTNDNDNNNNDDDDDDFGDFDEAPVSVSISNETYDKSVGVPTIEKIPLDGMDPIVTKVTRILSTIFIQYAPQDNHQHARVTESDGSRGNPIPRFDDNDIITIESALASLEIDTPIKNQVLSPSSIYPIEKLFTTLPKDVAENEVPIPSRFIISKRTAPLSSMYGMNRRTIISDHMIRMKAMKKGGQDGLDNTTTAENQNQDVRNNNNNFTIDKEHNQKDDIGPSDQAKALLERIPDLSYMLSPKLYMPNV